MGGVSCVWGEVATPDCKERMTRASEPQPPKVRSKRITYLFAGENMAARALIAPGAWYIG